MATYNLLKSIYSENQLKIVNTTKETGDILIVRNNKPVILVENKYYMDNVAQTEVDKFIRDINVQNYSGIFISQKSSIANKKEFEIAFYGNNVGIYISNANYDTYIIQIAIDTIDAIKSKIKDNDSESVVSEDEETYISKDELNSINNEYNLFVNKKIEHIKTIKEFSKKLIQETDDITLPVLFSILSENYGTNKKKEWLCNKCSCNPYPSKASLAAHMKAHTNKEVCTAIVEETPVLPVVPVVPVVTKKNNKKEKALNCK
jgi:hypothetical protein